MTKKSWRHRYQSYHERGVLAFLRKHFYKLIITLFLFISILLLLQWLFPELVAEINLHIANQNPLFIYIVFFLSESVLGILPPDLFILWSQKFSYSFISVSILALLSYAGGIVSYYIGLKISHWRRVEIWLEKKLWNKVKLIKEWGGLVIIIAALFPLPFSPICMAAGTLRYPRKLFLLYSSFRIVRFYLYAMVLFQLF